MTLKENKHFKITIFLGGLLILTGCIIYFFFPSYRGGLLLEGEWVESTAAILWLLGGVLCAGKFIFSLRSKRNKVKWFWLSFIFFISAITELDLLKELKKYQGMRFKMRWLQDASVSIFPKIISIAIFASIIGCVVIPVFLNRRKIIKALKEHHSLVCLFLLGMCFLGIGFLSDGSVLGKSVLYPLITKHGGKTLEEVCETVGALICFSAILPYIFIREKRVL